jgi:tight adherence protein C
MSLGATGALLGLVVGVGLVVIVVRSPRARRIRYADRVEPYLRDTPTPSRLLAERRRDPRSAPNGFAAVEALVRPFLDDAAGRLDRFLGGRPALVRRLTQAGGRTSLDDFRTQQVICAVVGGLVGAFVLALRVTTGFGPPVIVGVALVVAGVAGGVVGRDWWLSRAIREREDQMLMEFPTIAELLALAVTAGESPTGALERVARLTHGELGHELRLALADARAGATLVQALEGIAARTTLTPLTRFVDGMAVAIERGTPLADVLRAQAVDVREAGKRELLEAGGRKEIAMMIPVVFLVLPTTVIFAFYPALVSFTLIAQ